MHSQKVERKDIRSLLASGTLKRTHAEGGGSAITVRSALVSKYELAPCPPIFERISVYRALKIVARRNCLDIFNFL